MKKLKVDNQEYDVENLDDQTKNQVAMLKIIDREIQRLNAQLAIANTARNVYAKTITRSLKDKK